MEEIRAGAKETSPRTRRHTQLGGKARIAKLTPAQRSALARKAGKASGAARRQKKNKAARRTMS